MAFGHGKSTAVYLNGRDMSAYLKSASVDLTAQVNESTTFGKSARVFIVGLFDAMLTAAGFFEGSATSVDAYFKATIGAAADSLAVVWPQGDTAQGVIGYAMRARGTSYKVTAPVEGLVDTALSMQGDDDADRVFSLNPLAASSTTGNGTTYDDNAASSADGGAAHLHVTAITGTNIIVKVMHGDASDMSDESALITFTSATAAGTSERVAVSGTVKRYLRINRTGTFTSATFAVAFSRK